MISKRDEVMAYLNEQTKEWFKRIFDVRESIHGHIIDHYTEWVEIVLLKGEAELLAGEHLPDDLLEKVETMQDIVDAFMRVLENKTRILSST